MFSKIKNIAVAFLKIIIPKNCRHAIFRFLAYLKSTRYFIKRGLIAAIEREYGSDLLNNIDNETLKLFKAKLKKYADNYETLIFGFYGMRRIGEMALTLHIYLSEELKETKKLYVMFPIIYNGVHGNAAANKVLYEKIKKYMQLIDKDNAAFWLWVIKEKNIKGPKVEYSCKFDSKHISKRSMLYPYAEKTPKFSDSEESEATATMKKMGLFEPFICVYNRDDAFYSSQNFGGKEHVSNARNSSVTLLYTTAMNMKKENIQCVRVGSVVEEKCECDNLIDYSSFYRSELMDLYLLAHCKFFVVSGSGIMLIATLYGKPILTYNFPVISFGGDMVTPMTPERDIILMKKIWNKRENRYLTLREILKMEHKYRDYKLFDEYVKMGCEFVDNTPEEIWQAANEMNRRIDKTISYSDKEIELQRRYLDIVHTTTKRNNILFYNGAYSTDFLVNNPWFLE